MSSAIKSHRIESIDILRGVVMLIMALDHVRLYFNYGSFFTDPTDLETTTPFLFFTRFITHFCAPVFVFLAGTSAFLYGSKKTKPELFKFLFTRGIWLIFLELVVNSLIWTFDLSYSLNLIQVIWAIGISMVCLSFLVYLPKKLILFVGILLVAGHNALDGIVMEGQSIGDIVWYLLHQRQVLAVSDHMIFMQYPAIPWIGLMALGYVFGTLYKKDYSIENRKKWLLRIGFGAIGLFVLLRGVNIYGDLVPWTEQSSGLYTFFSFINVTKYPPSLLYLCITMGPALLFLYFIESTKNRITNFALVFGRVPLFYYFVHMIVIHFLALIGLAIFGGNWQDMVLTPEGFQSATLMSYGYPLYVVYAIWLAVILLLYPISKRYMEYKARNKDKWWLSYL